MLKKKVITICAALLFLTALGLTLYPPISNYVNRKYASEIQTAHGHVTEQMRRDSATRMQKFYESIRETSAAQ